MGLFNKQVKTVQSVLSTFTAGLKEVIAEQNMVATTAGAEKGRLERQAQAQATIQSKAFEEVTQARQGIDNITEMLGVKTK